MSKKIYVWDPMVRFFHWTLVLAFIIAYFTGEEESSLHINSGYYILGLVSFRIIWGVIGTHYARFSHFSFAPAAVKEYLLSLFGKGKSQRYIGHNPAGSWMVIAMLMSLLITSLSGLKVYGIEGYGPLAETTKTTIVAPSLPSSGFTKVSTTSKSDEHDDTYQETDSEEMWEEIHEFFANFTVLLIFIHLAGVLLSSFKHNSHLIRAMFTGYKQ